MNINGFKDNFIWNSLFCVEASAFTIKYADNHIGVVLFGKWQNYSLTVDDLRVISSQRFQSSISSYKIFPQLYSSLVNLYFVGRLSDNN